jgi:dephospho-CoA kinase
MGVIGLTGGIATGKSTVARMLAARGAAVVDADRIAREVVAPGTPGLAAVIDEFGAEVLGPSGGLDRERLGRIVFAAPERRRRLEAITHPLIRALTAERVAAALAAEPALVAVDIPLLFEAGRQADFPATMLVYADPETQIRRLLARDRLTEVEARQRLAAQMPIDEKRRLATWIVDNSGGLDVTADAVATWWADQVG